MQLVNFTYHDDMNEAGLAVTFTDPLLENVDYTKRNAVVMSRHGVPYSPKEVAIALRHLAMWCELLEDD